MDKRAMFTAGQYQCPAPPVPTTSWSVDDWINYIDSQGVWTPSAQPTPHGDQLDQGETP